MNLERHIAAMIRRNPNQADYCAERIVKLVEKNFTSTNTARDEISAIIAEYSSHKYIGCESCVRIIKRLRQLSPVA